MRPFADACERRCPRWTRRRWRAPSSRTRRSEIASETVAVLRDDLEMPVARLPERIADWHASACGTLVIASDGSTLVVDATGAGSALLLSLGPS